MAGASLKGRLLVAGPTLLDPNFRRTVVLVAEHSAEGAMGVVLNRPAEARVREAVPDLAVLVDESARVFIGGPVQTEAVVVLAEFDDPAAAGTLVAGDLGFLAAADADDPVSVTTRRARVFAGYAGWGPGQLDAEMQGGDWIVAPAARDDVFTDHPDALWRRILRRLGGRYAVIALMPDDPALN